MTDFILTGGGTVYLLQPVSDSATAWLDEHIGDDAQWLGRALAIEHRYVGNVLAGITEDGLTVQ